ncbi:hypothetical protein FS749_002502, partial [Ceratobasidium sp. UAMH 11750]
SSWLREALSEIDASCDTLSIICTPGGNRREPALRIHAVGSFGSTEVCEPKRLWAPADHFPRWITPTIGMYLNFLSVLSAYRLAIDSATLPERFAHSKVR